MPVRAAISAGLLFGAASNGALAQIAPREPLAGITVSGHGVVSVPPDRLRILVRLTPRNVTGEVLDGYAKSVAGAMQAAGIADAHEALPVLGMLGAQSAPAVVGTISKPTRALLESTLRAALKALPDATAIALANAYSVQTTLVVDDCSEAESRAQAAAIGDARSRARRIAAAAGLTLGAITSVNEAGQASSSACNGDLTQNLGFNTVNEDPYGPIMVPIGAYATVTFALR